MDIVGYVASVLGIITAVFSFLSWIQGRRIAQAQEREKKRLNRHVTVKLQYGAQEIELPVELRRAELTRAELLGRLGMIPTKVKGGKFSLRYLNTPEFFRQLNQVVSTDGDALLTIPCDKNEFEQFDVKG